MVHKVVTVTTPSTTASSTAVSTGEGRRESGRTHFTKLLSYQLKDISHPEMSGLADWALNEPGCLHTSQLSHLRNAKMRMLGVKSLDALGRINQAAHLFKTGDRKGLKALNTAQTTAKIEETLSRYEPVLHPETGAAMDAGDLMMVYLGYIELDLFKGEDTAKDWAKCAGNLGEWIEDLLEERGVRTREALAMIKNAWQGSDAGRDRFCLVVAGVETIDEKDLPELWSDITTALHPVLDEDISADDLFESVTA